MPTLRERFDAGVEAGIAPEELGKRFRDLGLTKADLDLDYEEAKKRGASRLFYGAEAEKAMARPRAEVPFKAPQMDLEALGQLKVGGTPPVAQAPVVEPKKGKEIS